MDARSHPGLVSAAVRGPRRQQTHAREEERDGEGDLEGIGMYDLSDFTGCCMRLYTILLVTQRIAFLHNVTPDVYKT